MANRTAVGVRFDPNRYLDDDEAMPMDYELAALLAPYGEQERGLEAQLKHAELLRNTGAPQGRTTGRIFTAPGALENVGALAQKGLGEYGNYQGRKEMKGMSEEMIKKMARMLEERRDVDTEYGY